MSLQVRQITFSRERAARLLATSSSVISPYGRAGPYRRIHAIASHGAIQQPRATNRDLPLIYISKAPSLQPASISRASYNQFFRFFSSRPTLFQQQQTRQDVRDPPRQEEAETEQAKAESTKSEQSSEGKQEESSEDSTKKKKEAPPPPPPHGDKSPWQVFTETLRSEFKASKEWNESTKALASSAHQFTENESIKKARAAYNAASGTAASTTSNVLKSTGKVIGQGAAWTWETPVVKGVRAGVNLTGKGIAKVTEPVRETEAYKKTVGTVKDVIDDGSSSRYGGWVEKEERRRQRELREMNEAMASGRPGRRKEAAVEDPK